MYQIKFLSDCYLCGKSNCEPGNICRECKISCSLISGQICKKCGTRLISEQFDCLRCRTNEYSFDRNISLFEYRNTAKEVFYQYKFRKHRSIAIWYASLLSEKIKKNYNDFVIVPSPYRIYKKIYKGWDQVECISNILKNKYGHTVVNILKRAGSSDQKKLNQLERKVNLKGKIKIKRDINRIIGKKVLFFDDIFTTGATSSECAGILKKNGAVKVVVLTIAID